MKKLIAFILLGFTSFVFADVDSFVVDVEPSTVLLNEAVDLKITAIDEIGNVVEDYEGDIWMEVEGLGYDDISLPSDGIYTFLPENKGEVTFSKGLIFRKEGTYNLLVSDILDESLSGEVEVTVSQETVEELLADVVVSSPIQGSIEKASTVAVVGSSSLPNSPIEIYLNGEKVLDSISDENGEFNEYLKDIVSGENEIKVDVVNIDGDVLGESEFVLFEYAKKEEIELKSIQLSSSEINESETVSVSVDLSGDVDSVIMSLGDSIRVILDDNNGTFSKELTLDSVGNYPISLEVASGEEMKTIETNKNITVIKKIEEVLVSKISNVKVEKDEETLTYSLSWDESEDVNLYNLYVGTGKDELELYASSQVATYLFTGVDFNQTHYLQIKGLKETVESSVSDLIVIEAVHESAPICVVKGIDIKTIKKGDKYFLTWDEIDGITKYVIYKSDSSTSKLEDMQKISETTENSYEYLFDADAESVKYAHYSVQAECEDGNNLQIGNIKKVQVGPMDTFIVLFLISLFMYLGYKLYGYSN